MGDRVSVLPAVSHSEALRIQQSADVLLFLLWNDASQPGVYTTKLFEYIGAHRPVLAVGMACGVAADLIRGRAAGSIATNSSEVESLLGGWLGDWRHRGRLPDTAVEAASGLTEKRKPGRSNRYFWTSFIDPMSEPKEGMLWFVSELYAPEHVSTGHFVTGIAEGVADTRKVGVICSQPTYAAEGCERRRASVGIMFACFVLRRRCWTRTYSLHGWPFPCRCRGYCL